MANSTTFNQATATRPRRGRPALTWWTLAEVGAELGITVEALARLLEMLPGALPGAVRHEKHGWVVPSGTLRALKEAREPVALVQEATVQEVANAIRKSDKTIYRWCSMRGPKGEVLLKSRKVAGEVLVDVRSVYELPAKLPVWAAPEFLLKRKESVA